MDFSWLEKIKEFFSNLNLDPIMQAVGRLKEVLGPFLENIGALLMWIWDNILAPLIQWIVEELAPVLIDVFSSVLEVINSVMEVIGPVLQDIWENILSPMFEWIGETVISVLEDLTGFLHDLSSLISGEITWDEFISGLSDTELLLGSVLTAFTLVYGAIGLFNAVIGIASTVTGIFSGVLAFFAANPAVLVALAIAGIIFVVLELIKHWDDMKNKLAEWEESLAEHVGNGKLEWEDFAYWVVVGIENVMRGIEKLFDWIGKLIDKLREAWKWLKKLLKSSDSFEYDYSADYDYGFSGYASGGFPDEGEMFVAREAGPEMVGTIGGRTAVATNADIVNAIKGGVYEAMAAALSTSGNRSGGGVVLNVNGREFMRAIWDDRNAVISEHGMSLITSG
jgi:phage-related protein